MRDLGTDGAPSPTLVEIDGEEGGQSSLQPAGLDRARSGPIQTLESSLTRAIARSRADDLRILVFRARWTLVGLHRWSEPTLPPAERVGRLIEDRIRDIDPSFVVEREGNELLGFAARPRTALEAELLAGLLAAELMVPVGASTAEAAVSPRLGVAIVGGAIPEPWPPEHEAADAIAAAARTFDQTMEATPYLVHNQYIQNRSLRQREVLSALPRALVEDQITLEFQPRLELATQEQVGLEVFPRWTHPVLGPVPTIEFLLVAEREGLLPEIGRRVRAAALSMARRWADEGTLGHRRLWFDVAPIELLDRGFADEAVSLVEQAGPVAIGFEISDDPILEHGSLVRVLDRLEELGVGVALDNLRPSTLCLGRMQRLPLTAVNLDRELVRLLTTDPVSCQLVRLICATAAQRGLSVTACQVETMEELRLAEELGVGQVQGYAVSKPMAEADLWPLLDQAGH